MTTKREAIQEAWTATVAEVGVMCGQVAGVLVYLGDESGDVEARSFLRGSELPRAVHMGLLDAMAEAIDEARKQLVAGDN